MSKIVPGTILSYGRKFNGFFYIKFVLSCDGDTYYYNISLNEQNMIYIIQNVIGTANWEIYQ